MLWYNFSIGRFIHQAIGSDELNRLIKYNVLTSCKRCSKKEDTNTRRAYELLEIRKL